MLTPANGSIVLALIDGEFTIKRHCIVGDGIVPLPENPRFLNIEISAETDQRLGRGQARDPSGWPALPHMLLILSRTGQARYSGCVRRLVFNLLAAMLLPATSYAGREPAPATVSACFTPGPESCAEQIADRIDAATASVRVQAYYLTQPLILRSIAAAKRRGLDVEAILDKSQDRHGSTRSRYSGATYLANAGVRVWIDDAPAIAHSKIIILDDHTVLTGSFNFTKSADTRNAENVVVIDSQTVAAWFTQNWENRKAASRRFEAE